MTWLVGSPVISKDTLSSIAKRSETHITELTEKCVFRKWFRYLKSWDVFCWIRVLLGRPHLHRYRRPICFQYIQTGCGFVARARIMPSCWKSFLRADSWNRHWMPLSREGKAARALLTRFFMHEYVNMKTLRTEAGGRMTLGVAGALCRT